MQLSDQQIVQILIDKYRRQGSDLSKVISDPVFQSLPLNSRMVAIRDNAAALSAGIKTGYTGHDFKEIGMDALIGAAGGAVVGPLAVLKSLGPKAIPNRGTLAAATLFSAILGGVFAGATGVVRQDQNVSKRNATSVNLNSLANTPTDSNTVKVLSNISRVNSESNTRLNKLMDAIDASRRKAVEDGAVSGYRDNS